MAGHENLPCQVMGILTFLFTLVTFSIGFFFPQVHSPLALPKDHICCADSDSVTGTNGAKAEMTDHCEEGCSSEEIEIEAVENELTA